MVVIYTGDIRKDETSAKYDIDVLQMCIEPAFLSELDGDEIYNHLKEKVETGEMLTDEELMQFIILPLFYPEKVKKQEKVRDTVLLAVRISDRNQQFFALAGILAFTDKIIDRGTANKIRRVIEMTQVAKIFEEEKQQALKEERLNTAKQVVINMIKKDYSSKEIASLVLDYSQDDVDKLRKELE